MMDTAQAEKSILPETELPMSGPADHALIDMPFHVEIDGRQYKGRGVSLVRAEISGLIDPQMAGAQRIAWVVFSLQGYTVALTVSVRVENVDQQKGFATLVFMDPMGDHLPQLRHMMNSFIAGDLVTLGEVLAVRSVSDAPGKPKATTQDGIRQRLRQLSGSALIIGLSVALVTLVTAKVFQRAYMAVLPTPATAVVDGRTLSATATGQIDYLNPKAKSGEVAFTLRANSGQTLSVAMPCDCKVQELGVTLGATVFAGDPVLHLSEPNAPLILTGFVPAEQALDLASAGRLDIRFADGSHASATLAPSGIAAAGTEEMLAYRLTPTEALPETRAGQMAEITIHRPVPPLLSPFASLSTVFSNAVEAIFP
jgi:mannuronan synthase